MVVLAQLSWLLHYRLLLALRVNLLRLVLSLLPNFLEDVVKRLSNN